MASDTHTVERGDSNTQADLGSDLAASHHTSAYKLLHLQKIKFDSTLSLSCE